MKATTLDWVVVGAGLLAYISSFFRWYQTSISVFGIERSAGVNAWNAGFGAWFAVLLLVVAGGLVLASMLVGWRGAPTPLITLGASTLAFVTIVLRWVTFPDANGGQVGVDDVEIGSLFTASGGAGFGLYVGLIAALAAAVASFLSFRAGGHPGRS
ncbi:MAG TPA: hypothetical protein VIY28_07805 [Pseudonocardiaceae bacterium]